MIRIMDEDDRKRVLGWLEQRGVPQGMDKVLPEPGYIVNECCAFFVYTVSNAPVCFIEWVCSDPESKDSVEGLRELAGHCADIARECEKEGVAVITILSKPGLCRLFEKSGFRAGCGGETTMVFNGG